MPVDINDTFIYKADGFDIEFRLGVANNGNKTFLPEDILVADLIVEGGYPDNLPIGVPEGIKATFTFDTTKFTEDLKPFAKGLLDNKTTLVEHYELGTNMVLIRRGESIDYVGVQQPADKEMHSLHKKTYSINTISAHKYALEMIDFKNLAKSEPDAFFIYKGSDELRDDTQQDMILPDYVVVGDLPSFNQPVEAILLYSAYRTENWSYVRMSKFTTWIKRFIEMSKDIMFHIYAKTNIQFDPEIQGVPFVLPTFFKQNTDGTLKPTDELTNEDLYIIQKIFFLPKAGQVADDFERLVGGYDKFVMNKYKNFWNYLIAFSEGLGKRVRFNLKEYETNTGVKFIDLDYSDIFISSNDSIPHVLSIDRFVPTSQDDIIEVKYGNYKEINLRVPAVKNDLSRISLKVADGSMAKSTFEATSLLNNYGSHQDKFNNRNSYSEFDVKNSNVPDSTKLYYKTDLIFGYTHFNDKKITDNKVNYLKVADHCKIQVADNSTITNSFSDGIATFWEDNEDKRKENIDTIQKDTLNSLVARIIKKVIGERQIWLTVHLPVEYGNINYLGRDFLINLKEIFPQSNFYSELDFSERCVLVRFKTDYVKKYSECTFYIRSDEWA